MATEQKKNLNDGFYVESNKNFAILVQADSIGWKIAKKTKGMVARLLSEDVEVMSIEGPLKAKKGDWFCIGAGGDYWVQSDKSVTKKYNSVGSLKESVTVDYMKNGQKQKFNDFLLFEPKPEDERLVCKMPNKFEVHASWGLLQGKKGDYLVKGANDALNLDPQDVWLVDRSLFEATYEIK